MKKVLCTLAERAPHELLFRERSPSPMRRCRVAAMLGLVCLGLANGRAQSTSPHTSLAAVRAISNSEAAQSMPVAFEGFVTYHQPGNIDLFVQEGDAAIYVEAPASIKVSLGDRVLVEGQTRASFRPEIVARRMTVVRHGIPPKPAKADFIQLIQAKLDCRRVTVRGVVRGANVVSDGASRSLMLDVLMAGGYVQAQIIQGALSVNQKSLQDSEVEITGAAAGKFDSKSQMTGILIEVFSMADVRVVNQPRTPLDRIPIRPFEEILQAYYIHDKSERVRVEGTITYDQPGSAIVLQSGEKALWIDTLSEERHAVGDRVVVSGFPEVRNGSVVLVRGEIETTESHSLIQPVKSTTGRLASGQNAYELVSVEGQLVMQVREAAQDQYVIVSQGHVFSAVYRHPERGLGIPLPAMQNLQLDSTVRISGICVLDKGDQFQGPAAFRILLRSSQDLKQLTGPSLVSVRNLGIVAGILLLVLLAAVARALLLERRLHRQDAAKAESIERWRNHVIDGINKGIPLAETLLQITELASFKLEADYCWVELRDYGVFGKRPPTSPTRTIQIIDRVITTPSGESLGCIYAGFKKARRRQAASDRLGNTVRLASLAIETDSRYSELIRRSEVDPLTATHNRFAFERALSSAISESCVGNLTFALIYIDLDRFKQVNDENGHSIGDLYLQEVTSRLRHQLRSYDVLARIGGDEFTVILPSIGSAEEVSEVVTRLESCFDAKFALGGREISGTASIGSALFPNDGTTREALLESADVRMYAIKRQRRQLAKHPLLLQTMNTGNEKESSNQKLDDQRHGSLVEGRR